MSRGIVDRVTATGGVGRDRKRHRRLRLRLGWGDELGQGVGVGLQFLTVGSGAPGRRVQPASPSPQLPRPAMRPAEPSPDRLRPSPRVRWAFSRSDLDASVSLSYSVAFDLQASNPAYFARSRDSRFSMIRSRSAWDAGGVNAGCCSVVGWVPACPVMVPCSVAVVVLVPAVLVVVSDMTETPLSGRFRA